MVKGCRMAAKHRSSTLHAFSHHAILYARWICIARLLLPKWVKQLKPRRYNVTHARRHPPDGCLATYTSLRTWSVGREKLLVRMKLRTTRRWTIGISNVLYIYFVILCLILWAVRYLWCFAEYYSGKFYFI